MYNRLIQPLLLTVAGVIALLFVKLMFDMNATMVQMAGHMGSLTEDVAAMKGSIGRMADNMEKMQQSMQRIDTNIQGMGNPLDLSGQKMQQWNPAEMMRQGMPGSPH